MKSQRLLMPWETSKWPDIKKRIAEKINSTVDMDSRLASLCLGKLRPRKLTEMFTAYYADSQYEKDRIPQQRLIDEIFPMLQNLIENAQKTFKGFDARALVPGANTNLVLNRLQAATLITCMWFGLFNYNYLKAGPCKIEYFPEPLFLHAIDSQNMFWLQCMLNYFSRVHAYINDPDDDQKAIFNAGNIILKRQVTTEFPDWSHSTTPICPVAIGDGHTTDTPAKLHVVYAHELIGGDMFKNNLSQEEVILLIKPECLLATIFCSQLCDNEALIILGAEKVSQYVGHGSSVKFAGNYIDSTPRGLSKDETEIMSKTAAIFIDATTRTSMTAHLVDDFTRDLNKAFCGFDALQFSKVEQLATGNWMYGFNGNHMQAKFLQQLLAASESGKSLIYHPYGRDFEDKVLPFIDWLAREQLTVGQLLCLYYQLIGECYKSSKSRIGEIDIFEYLMVS